MSKTKKQKDIFMRQVNLIYHLIHYKYTPSRLK